MPRNSSDFRYKSDIAACRQTIRGGSKTFFAASLLLPRRVRDPAYALYAFCRLSDDTVDLEGGRLASIGRLRDRLERAYAGRPLPLAVDRALADTVERFQIPSDLPLALLEGLEWDAQGRQYRSLSDLSAYAARVAGSVGAMMALLMGARRPDLLARACDLGLAMQLTNIVRDIGEDARNGRLYLPLDWFDEMGIDPGAWLAAPCCSAPIRAMASRMLVAADQHYARADAGIARLPLDCRPGISAARTLYAEIGREVERRGFDSVTVRAVVSNRRKAALLGASIARALRPARPAEMAVAPEAAFLVSAVAERRDLTLPRRPRWWHLGTQTVAAIEMFDRLERQDRQRRGLGSGWPERSVESLRS
jgi:15-cis-phytoene synthase